MMMKLASLLALLAVAMLTMTTETAQAQDRWGRPLYGIQGGFNCYDSPLYGTETIYFLDRNEMLMRIPYGYGTSIIVREPIQRFGAPGINYRFDRYGNIDPYASGLIQRQRPMFWFW
jgi:hypothetical protein